MSMIGNRRWRQARRELVDHGMLRTSQLLVTLHESGLILVGLEHHAFVGLTPKEARERAALLNELAAASESRDNGTG